MGVVREQESVGFERELCLAEADVEILRTSTDGFAQGEPSGSG